MPQIRGIIFDMDGTLVDSRLDYDAIRREMGLSEGIPILEGLERVPDGSQRDRMLEVMHAHELRGADEAVPIEGVMEFLSHLEERGVSSAVLTRNSRESTARTLTRLNHSFSQIITREDALPKPDPAGVHLIAQRWGLPPHEMIVIGDYLFDIQAGRRAGARSILFAPGSRPDYAHEADFVLQHFRDAVDLINRMACLDEPTGQ